MSPLDSLFGHVAGEIEPNTEQRVQQLLALNRATIAITSELELDSLLQRIVDVARDLVGCKYAALGVLGEDGYIARFPTSGISESDREQIGALPRGHGLLGVMLHAGDSLRIPDISKDPRRVGFPPHHPPMFSLLGVPIFVRGKLMGDLYLTEKNDAPEFSEEDEWLVQLLATHAATALTNAQLHAENIAALRDLQALQDAVQQIASHLDLESMAAELLRYASQVTGSKLAWLGLLDKDGKLVTTHLIKGAESKVQSREQGTLEPGPWTAEFNGPTGRALRVMRPQIVKDIETDPELAPWLELVDLYNVHSGISVPMLYQGRALGVLSLYSRSIGSFTGKDLALLQVMSDHAAVALQNAIHYQQVIRERARSQALLKVNQAINRSVHLDEVLALIVQSSVELLEASGAAVYILEQLEPKPEEASEAGIAGKAGKTGKSKQKQYAEFVAGRYSAGLAESSEGQIVRLPVNKSMAGRAVRSGKTQVVNDSRDLPRIVFPRLSGDRPLLSLVAAPLLAGEQTLGVLSIYSTRPAAFDADAVQLLETLGAQASTAINNARLYEEARRGREAAEQEQQRLREVEHMKDEFLSVAAHELRTPLTTIRMSAGLALEQLQAHTGEGKIDPRLLDLMGLVAEGSERMHSLVNDLLDLTRLEQGRTSLNLEELDLREVVRASVEATGPLFESKQQRLAMHMSEAHCYVKGDRQRLEQVLINLLSNAHKYSPAGSQVEIRVLRNGNECRVTVRDNGPGVPPEERERIFERFYRSSMHRKDRTASTGLGLPIAGTIAEMHRGRVWVEPAPGHGSIFSLALPAQA